jgi:hypothetical protein
MAAPGISPISQNPDTGIWNTARTAAIIADTLARQRELWGVEADQSEDVNAPVETNSTDINYLPVKNKISVSSILVTQIVILVVFILLEVILFLTYRILIHHNKLDYKRKTIARLLLIAFPIMELIMYSIIFFKNFDRFLGASLLLSISLILIIFSFGVIYIQDEKEKAANSNSSDDEFANTSKLCPGWTTSRIRWNSTVNVSKIASTGTNPPNDDSLLVTGDGRGDESTGLTYDVPLKTWNSKEMTNIIPKNQSSPKPKTPNRSNINSRPGSRAMTPSILKTSKPTFNRSISKNSPNTNKELLPPLKTKEKNKLIKPSFY